MEVWWADQPRASSGGGAMHFLILSGILAALVSAECWGATPVPAAPARCGLVLAGIGIVWIIAQIVAGITVRSLDRQHSPRQSVLKRFTLWQWLHTWLWLGISAAILWGLKWAAVVQGNWQLAGTFLIDELLILAPLLLGQLAAWSAFYEVDRAVRRTSSAAVPLASVGLSRGRFVALHARHYFGLLLVPLLAVCALCDLSAWTAARLGADGVPGGMILVALGGVGLGFPWLLRYLWDTTPLSPGTLRDRLEGAGRQLEVSIREILLWRTDGRIANAAVTGVLPALRYVLLSDALLRRLSEDQLVAMYKHELGHVRHRHPPLRLLALAAPLAVWQLAVWLLPDLAAAATAGGGWAGSGSGWAVPGLLIASLGLAGFAFFAWYARMMELQADLAACGFTTARPSPSPGDPPEEARQLAATLSSLMQLPGQRGGGWLHPSLRDRIRFLHQASGDPRRVALFQRRMRLIAIALAVTVAAGIFLPGIARGVF